MILLEGINSLLHTLKDLAAMMPMSCLSDLSAICLYHSRADKREVFTLPLNVCQPIARDGLLCPSLLTPPFAYLDIPRNPQT